MTARFARVLLVAAVVAAASPGRAAPLAPGEAARVNGAVISTERLDRYFEDFLAESGRNVAAIRSPAAYAALRQEALDRLVDAELLWQEAQRAKLVATPAEVDAALAEVRAGFKRPGAFEQRLSRGGFTAASYSEWLRVQLSIRRLVQEEILPRVAVTDAEVEAAREVRASRSDLPEPQARGAAAEQARLRKAEAALAVWLKELRRAATIELARRR